MAENETKSVDGFENATLYSCTAKGRTALETAKALTGDGVFFLAYTPDFCGFVSCQDGKFVNMDGKDIAPETVFELRCFCQDFDLRWVREEADGTGNGMIISENQINGWTQEPVCNRKGEPLEFFKRTDHYLLWGKGTVRGGRVRLFEHRVGELPIPAEAEEKLNKGGRVWLSFDEYFSPDDYGNMVWQTERLKGFLME